MIQEIMTRFYKHLKVPQSHFKIKTDSNLSTPNFLSDSNKKLDSFILDLGESIH